MEEQKISFETAKLAKEKGIDLPHTHYYVYPFRSFKATGDLKINATNDDYNHNLLQVVNTRKMQPHMAPAYNQPFLQKWLREEHKIHFHIYYGKDRKWCIDIYSIKDEIEEDYCAGQLTILISFKTMRLTKNALKLDFLKR